MNLPAFAGGETLRTLHNVLRLPFTGSNHDQTYLAKAKKTALAVLRDLISVKGSEKLHDALELNVKKVVQELKAKVFQ